MCSSSVLLWIIECDSSEFYVDFTAKRTCRVCHWLHTTIVSHLSLIFYLLNIFVCCTV